MHGRRQTGCLIISIALSSLAYLPSQADWSEPIPVTTDTLHDEHPIAVVIDSTHLWAAWHSYARYHDPAAIKVSYFDGASWSSPQVISQYDELVATPPAITKDTSDSIWVAWYYGSYIVDLSERLQQEDWGLYTSTYDGYSWGGPELAVACTSEMGGVGDQVMALNGSGRLCMSWSAQTDLVGSWLGLSVFLSHYEGLSWSPPECIAEAWGWPPSGWVIYGYPYMTADDSTGLWLSYVEMGMPGPSYFSVWVYHYSGGDSAPRRRLSESADDWEPVIANDGQGRIWLVWVSDRDGNANIYSSYRDAGGWSDTVAITTDEALDSQPSIGIDPYGWVWVAWTSNRDGDPNIYVSYNYGSGWSTEEAVTSDTAWDAHPYILSDESRRIWVLWQNNRHGRYDIYSAYNPTPGVKEKSSESPAAFPLLGNRPNPFNSHTEIKYQIPERGFVTLRVYNLLGQPVRTLVSGEREPGCHSVVWNGRNNGGATVPTGVYFCRMATGGLSQTKKLLLLR